MRTQKGKTTKRTCVFCGEFVDEGGEGVMGQDGTIAHEDCHDGEEFRRENAVDLAEHEETYTP
jgi:hypothetical protein